MGDAFPRAGKWKRALNILLAILAVTLPSVPVLAATAGGATVHNVATVSFSGNTATDSEDVIVGTLATDPTITVDTTAQTVAPSATATYTYTFTNNANGSDTFGVASASVDAGISGPPTLNLNGSGTANTSITLGATIVSAASDVGGNVYIPAGSEANLATTDTVVVAGIGTYTINSITAGTPATTVAGVTTAENPTILTLTPVSGPATGAVPVGTQIGEQTSFTLVLTANTPSVVGVDGTHAVNLTSTTTATDAGAAVVVTNTSAGSSNETITTVSASALTFTKEVRNITKGTAFVTTGATVESGDILEYRITATPAPGGGNITSSVLVDDVPANTTYQTGTAKLNTFPVADVGGTLATTTANGGLSINSPSGGAGVLVDGESAVLLFQVQANPPGPGSVITNTATLNFGAGSSTNASVNATSVTRTASSLQLMQYAPGVSGATNTPISQAQYWNGSAWQNVAAITDASGAAITVPGSHDLLPASNFNRNEPIFIQVTDNDNNINSTAIDTVSVTITGTGGDSEMIRLIETGVNTGIFVGYVPVNSGSVVTNDGYLTTAVNETVAVGYTDSGDSGDTSSGNLVVDPYGVVFDSATGNPVNGVSITLWDVGAGAPAATIYNDDGSPGFPATITTGSSFTVGANNYNFPAGTYRFPFIPPGTYELRVTAPGGYTAPSTVPTATLQTSFPTRVIVTGSKAESFAVNPGPAIHIDIPIDPTVSSLYINKTASRTNVAVGDFLQYRLEISNTGASGFTGTTITDVLPRGFRFQSGSTTIDGVSAADPTISPDGRTLTFTVGALAAATTIDLRYVTSVTGNASLGRAVNSASGTANGGGVVSNNASAVVQVQEELFGNQSQILGRVMIGNCELQPGETGAVSLRLTSRAEVDKVFYTARLSGNRVDVGAVKLVITLPSVLEYIPGSSRIGENMLPEPKLHGQTLTYLIGDRKGDWADTITLTTRARATVHGEFTTLAYGEFSTRSEAHFDTPTGVNQRTPVAVNRFKDYSRVVRPIFDVLSAELRPADRLKLEDLALSLQDQKISKLHIIGHADQDPIAPGSNTLFKDNQALSVARAKAVGDYLRKLLNLTDNQVSVQGEGDERPVFVSARLEGRQLSREERLALNRRVEVLVELKDQTTRSRFLVSEGDSGVQKRDTLGGSGRLGKPRLGGDLPGLKGVRLFLEDGRFVDSDEQGLFHFKNVRPGTHVVQVDTDSLPSHLEVYECESNTRVAGTPASRFVDVQGGSIWRTDFYLRPKAPSANTAQVGLRLQTRSLGNSLEYTATISGGPIAFNNRYLVVGLGDGMKYRDYSVSIDGQPLADPVVQGRELRFALGDRKEGKWQQVLKFRVDLQPSEEGEATSWVQLAFQTADGKQHHSAISENSILRQASTRQRMVFDTTFPGKNANLSETDIHQLDGVIDFFTGKPVRQIDVVAHTDNRPVPVALQNRFPDNYALARARALAVGQYLQKGLGLHSQQVRISGEGADKPVTTNATPQGRQRNRRVELYITLADQKSPMHVYINHGDSGMKTAEVENLVAHPVDPEFNKLPQERFDAEPAGILGIKAKQLVATRINAIRIKLDEKLKPRLSVDGKVVSNDLIGFKRTGKGEKTLYTYIGVDLGDTGNHVLKIEGVDPFGNARFEQSVPYRRTGGIADIRYLGPVSAIADGKTPIALRLELRDANGDVVRSPALLQVIDGNLKPQRDDRIEEIKTDSNVVEVSSDGIIRFDPVSSSGSYYAKLKLNDVEIDVRTYVQPHARDWILVGLAEGTMAANNLKGNMQNLGAADLADTYKADGRVAFYAKGKVKGNWLLTMAYDSAKETGRDTRRLHGIINPDEYYTIYGDKTEQGFDAPSSEKLYVRIEKDRFYALFGDYDTGLTVTELGRYQRSLTGIKTEYQGDKFNVNAFASQTDQAFVKDEIRGDGTSGLYSLSRKNIIINSEKITIETRDRFQSQVVLNSKVLVRNIDYNIDPIEGIVYFKQPVYGHDDNFNPVYIVVDYEVLGTSGSALTVGGRVGVHSQEGLGEMGATIIHDGTPGATADLQSVDYTATPSKETEIRVEAAQSSKQSGVSTLSGRAVLAEVEHKGKTSQGKIYYRQQDEDFGIGQQKGTESGTRKYGAEGRIQHNDNLSSHGEILHKDNLATGASGDMFAAGVDYRKGSSTFGAGVRYAADEIGGVSYESSLLTGRAVHEMMDKRLKLHSVAELAAGSDANPDYPSRLLVGADYRVTSRTSVFAEQEQTYGANQDASMSRVGLRTSPWAGATFTSSVENQSAENNERLFANTGLTQGIKINEKFSIDFGIDSVATLRHPGNVPFNVNTPLSSGTLNDDYTAVTAGTTYKDKLWSATSRFEYRDGEQADKIGILLGWYRQQTPGLGLLARAQYFDTDQASGHSQDTNLQFAIAYRPIESRWIVLNRSEMITNIDTDSTSNRKTQKFINNLAANLLIDRENQLAFNYGYKYVDDSIDGAQYNGITQLFGTEYRHDISDRWDIGIHGNTLVSGIGNNNELSWGVSTGWNVGKGMWLSTGYNFTGFEDNDFSAATYSAQGFYVRFRFSFDQQTARNTLAWWEKRKQ